MWEWKTGDHEKYGGGKRRLESAGPNCMGRNRGTGKCRTKFSRVEKAGPPSMESEMDKYRCTAYN